MKKYFFILIIPFLLCADTLEILNLKTDLYSKASDNLLKKINISLEINGENLESNKAKIIDSINSVISSFFYEDIFTELGKGTFKQTLEKFIYKKYKIKINSIYILSLNSVEKFDIEELKRFLKSQEKDKENLEQALHIKTPEIPEVPKVSLNNDLNLSKIENINLENNLTLDHNTSNILPQIFKENNISRKENNSSESTGFEIKLDENQTL
ncbi:hypothetical protein [Campylobacter novaezeelandiae]|uniref:hypothetical protein n=1 Tax=Campylobacter novaezeelandiae TaxID=2267891 RepID=UPI001903B8C6|nr:hypothetical protein [Campylobacter novaezeelandiae]MBK1964196.1 hypothetical protein [Campylobacter novaezeelandiae]